MGLLISTTFGLALWMVLYAIGAKSFDAFLATLLIIVIAVAARAAKPLLNRLR